MTTFGHFGFASLVEQAGWRSPSLQAKNLSSTFASPKGREGTDYTSPAARHLEESRVALAWSLGRCIETPIPISPPSTLCLQAANPARLASTHPNICSTSTNSNASCIPSLAVWPPSSEKTAPTSPALTGSDLRPPRMPRARRAAAGSPLLRQALHAAEPLRGLAPHNIRHRYAAWERARGRAPAWVLAHGPSSASSSDEDEDDAFEQSMGHSWDGILDAYEDEQMAGWDHWSGRKLQPDQLDDEWC